MRSRPLALATCIATFNVAAAAHAQSASAIPQGVQLAPVHVVGAIPSTKAASVSPATRSREPELARTAAFRATATTGGIVVIRVPLPAQVRAPMAGRSLPVTYRIVAEGSARVLGRAAGGVTSADSSVLVTLSLSRSTNAGRQSAALVEFLVGGASIIAVPIELDVPSQRNLQLVVADAFLGAVRGEWMNLRFELNNRGNDVERASIKTVLPAGWRSTTPDLPENIEIAPASAIRGTVRVWIPSRAIAGQALARILLQNRGTTIAQSEVRVDVRDAAFGAPLGPQLTVTGVGASAPDGSQALGYGATLTGQVADSVFVDARMTVAPGSSALAHNGLARTGVVTAPPMLSVRSPHVQLSAGAVGTELHELSGFFVNGLGASTRFSTGGFAVTAFNANPLAYSERSVFSKGEGALTSLGVERTSGTNAIALQGAHLSEAQGARSLDALSLQARSSRLFGGGATGEVGYRDYGTGAGLGYAGSFHRVAGGSTVDLRATHAPGGSRAFARAENDVFVSMSQQVGSVLSVAGGGWHQRDGNTALGALASDGWYVAPSVSVHRIGTTIGLEARGNRFASTGPGGRYLSDEREAGGSLDSRWKSAFLSLHSTLGQVNRAIDLGGVRTPDARGLRLDSRASLGAYSSMGTFELSASSQQYSGAAGLLPRQNSISGRMDRIRVPMPRALPVFVNADVQRLETGALTGASWIAHGGVTVSMPLGLNVTLQAERNPFLFSAVRGGRNLMYSLRLDRTTTLPRFAPRRSRAVFVDENDNGQRDPGERGVAGVSVSCGAGTVVTDKEGRFSCPLENSAIIDARTVPTGLLAPNMTRATTQPLDVALRPVQVQRVRLVLAETDNFKVTQSDLARVLVMARDATGSPWTARATTDAEFVFDALPPGRYQIEVDAGDVNEPLRPTNALPELWIRQGGKAETMTIELKPRAIKMQIIESHAEPVAPPAGSNKDARKTAPRTRTGSANRGAK